MTGEPVNLRPGADDADGVRVGDEAEAPLLDAEDTITIDSSAILAGFESRPWTRPALDGVEPLADDAFKTKEAWLNFSILKELNKKATPRLEGETAAAYENRINQLAMDEFNAGRLPLSPTTDNVLQSLAILPTPSGTLQRLAPDHVETHDLAQGIAGDHSTQTVGNRGNRPTTPGGSVFQRAQRWMMSMYITRITNNAAYAQYVTGKAAASVAGNAFEATRVGLPLIGRAAREGKLTRAEFNAYVGRAANSNKAFEMFGKPLSETDMAIVKQAAEQQRALYAQFEAKIRDLSIFDIQAQASKEIEWRKAANERDLSRLEGLRSIKLRDIIRQEIADREAKIAELEKQLEEMQAEPIVPAGEEYYFPRLFDVGKIRADYDNFVKRIADAYGGDDALARAKVTVDRILGEGGEEYVPGMGTPKHLKGRQIPLTNEELADYIVWDSELVMGLYARRMGATIEMFDRYGSRFLDKEFDDLKAALRRDGYDEKRIGKILQQEEDLRDRVLGRFHGKDPMSWDNRVVRAIKNYGSLTLMGRGIYSQSMDVARTVATEGYKPVWQAMHTMLRGELKDFQRGSYAKEAGEAMELINARWMAQLIDNDSALTVTNQTALERGLAGAQSAFFQLNLMNPFTVVWKEFASTIQTHVLLTEARQVAAAVRSGKTLQTMTKKEQATVARLNSWGIDLRTAQTIADMPVEKLEGGDLLLANMENWKGRDGERARDILLGAISGTARASTITPGPLQRAAIMDGVFRVGGKRVEAPILSLPFQLMSFTMASSAKLTHSMLSGRDRSVATSLTALMLGGAFATWLKSPTGFDYMEPEEFALNTLENSSVLGYLSDVYKRIEDVSGYGPRAALGIDGPGDGTVTEKVGAIAGPAPGIIAGMIEAFVSDSPDLSERERAGMVRRAIPMSGLVWWNSYMKELSNLVADAGMFEGASQPSAQADEGDFESVEINSSPAAAPAVERPVVAAEESPSVFSYLFSSAKKAASEFSDEVIEKAEQLTKAVPAFSLTNLVGETVATMRKLVTAPFADDGMVNAQEKLPEDVRGKMSGKALAAYEAYAKTGKDSSAPFIIVDKPSGMTHIFNPDGTSAASFESLMGAAISDTLDTRATASRSAAPSASPYSAGFAQEQRVTPSGEFIIRPGVNTAASESDPTARTALFLADPKTGNLVGNVAIHTYPKGSPRLAALQSAKGAEDRRITFGCITASREVFERHIAPNVSKMRGSRVFVVSDMQS
jgi:hypothetical protein